MEYPILEEGILLKRYKRFLADVTLKSTKETIVAHTPNTGSMKTCYEPGDTVFLSISDNPKRKLKHTLEIILRDKSYINVNTHLTNKIVHEALQNQKVKELKKFTFIKAEHKIKNSRFDFYLKTKDEKDLDNNQQCFVEVKNVTMKSNEYAIFPDAVSTRASKHLLDLADLAQQGFNCYMLYVISRNDVKKYRPASEIDDEYFKNTEIAKKAGVKFLAYNLNLDPKKIELNKSIPVELI